MSVVIGLSQAQLVPALDNMWHNLHSEASSISINPFCVISWLYLSNASLPVTMEHVVDQQSELESSKTPEANCLGQLKLLFYNITVTVAMVRSHQAL